MKLDRNLNANGRGKYALLKLRKLDDMADGPFQRIPHAVSEALSTLERAGILDWGNTPETEFFVIRLKDQYAEAGLKAYAAAAWHDDQHEYSEEIRQLSDRAGPNHPNCKMPD